MQRCPVCGSKALGKLSNKQYYCWDCCLEFSRSAKGLRIYQVLDDGTLQALTLEQAKHSIIC